MSRRIETEKQYQNSLKWLVEKAEQLEHPLFPEEKREALLKQYDFVSDGITDYNRRRIAKDHPDMKEIYEELGFLPREEIPQPTKVAEEKKEVNLAAWLGGE